MMKRLQTIALLVAASALLAVPAAGQAEDGLPKGKGKGESKAKGNGKAKDNDNGNGNGNGKARSKCVVQKGFVVKGTLVSFTPDNATTGNANEQSLTITVTDRNRHARLAGLTDSDAGTAGLQLKLDAADDAFSLRLAGFEANETPAAGDMVRIIGKVAVTKKKCAPSGASLEDRYGDVNVRKVKIVDAD